MSKEQSKRPDSNLSIEQVSQLAIEVLLRDGEHLPTLIIDGTRNAAMTQMPDMPPTHEERLQLMFAAGHALSRHRALGDMKQVFFVTEGWMSQKKDAQAPIQLPSQDPNRLEVLIVAQQSILTEDGSAHVYEMKRDPSGTLIEITPYELPDDASHSMQNYLLDAFVGGYRTGRTT